MLIADIADARDLLGFDLIVIVRVAPIKNKTFVNNVGMGLKVLCRIDLQGNHPTQGVTKYEGV